MCLGIPAQVIEISQEDGILMGKVNFGGISRKACLEYVPEVVVGDYVLIHVGFALSKINEEEAFRIFTFLKSMDELNE